MNLKRCDNGHFYDGDKFQSCPHCAAVGGGNAQLTAPYADAGGGFDTAVTEPVTMPMYTPAENQQAAPEPIPAPAPVAVPGAPQGTGGMSLQDAVNRATIVPVDMHEEEKTVSLYQLKTNTDPVTGWLVCIEGSDFGNSFTLKGGRNFIGRAASMDIVLKGDNSISREKHAIILYEPKRREFIAQAGESRELFYLNEEVVLNPVRLKQHDILTIGNTRLMFFPCCGEHFSWDDFKKEEG